MNQETRKLLSQLKKLRLDEKAQLLAAFASHVAGQVEQAGILPPGPTAHIAAAKAGPQNLLRVLRQDLSGSTDAVDFDMP